MIAYIDPSALLRIVLREPRALDDLLKYDGLISSELIAVESTRTIDRLRLQGKLTIDEAADRMDTVNDWLERIDLVLRRRPVLNRASEPMPMPLGTLDAIHLATLLPGGIASVPWLRWRPMTRLLVRQRAPSASMFAEPDPAPVDSAGIPAARQASAYMNVLLTPSGRYDILSLSFC